MKSLRVAWIVDNVGPYHDARFCGLAGLGDLYLEVIEIADRQGKYPWTRPGCVSYTRTTLFPDHRVEDLPQTKVTVRLLSAVLFSRFDVVVVGGYSRVWDIAAAIAARLTGKLAFTIFETTEMDRPRKPRRERFKAFAMRRLYDGVFCSGSRCQVYLRKLNVASDRVQAGYSVVDNNHFATPRQKNDTVLPTGPFFLTVTRFAAEKNLMAMLNAYEEYCAEHTALPDSSGPATQYLGRDRTVGTSENITPTFMPGQGPPGKGSKEPWPLVMCGSGPLDQKIRERANSIGAGLVFFPGFLGYDELPWVYQRAGCMILPSLSEPWGLVVNEALAVGTPVIVSDRCGCAPDLVENGNNGFVYDPAKPDSLAGLMGKMAAMSSGQRSAMGYRGKEIVANYTSETWAHNFLELVGRVR